MTDEKKTEGGLEDQDWDQALAEWENTTFVPQVARDVISDRPAALSGALPPRALYRPPSVPPAAPVAPPRRPGPVPLDPKSFANEEDDEDATLIAVIPPELLRPEETSRFSRGGLGQIFGRDPGDPPSFRPEEPLPSEAINLDTLFDPPTAARAQQLTLPAQEEIQENAPAARRDEEAIQALAVRPSALPPARSSVGPRVAPSGAPAVPVSLPPSRGPRSGAPTIAPTGAASIAAPPLRGVNVATPSSAPAPASPRATRSSAPPMSTSPASTAPKSPRPAPARTWHEEKPADAWLDDAARSAVEDRAEWLTAEARAVPDKVARARALLACSEMVATSGDRGRAHALAAEACELAPSLALAHRQARALTSWPPDPEEYLEALEIEVKLTPAGPARVHSTLLVADSLRSHGHADEANKRLEQAIRMTGTDVRVALARAAGALAKNDPAGAALRLPDGAEFATVAEAITTCLRLRGVNVKDAAGEGRVPSPNEHVLRAREATSGGRVGDAAMSIAALADVAELSIGARWLAAALASASAAHRPQALAWLTERVEAGDDDARPILLARALEVGDRDLVAALSAGPGPFSPAERVVLAALSGLPLVADDPNLDAAAAMPGMSPLVCAIAAVGTPPDQARARRTAGAAPARAGLTLGRLLAARADAPALEAALENLGQAKPDGARGIALELLAREGRFGDLSVAVEAMGAADPLAAALAAALVAERAQDAPRALAAFKRARAADPTCEVALRAVASLELVDLVSEMNAVADECGDGLRGALARLEAVTRGEGILAEPTRAHMLERAHRAAPGLPIASFMAERIARRAGDIDEVLRWVRERRSATTDPIEAALDSVREALLVADREPGLASERLREAHLARPSDVALRDLYERMASDPLDDRASWRERRAAEASGDARVLLSLEAAHEYERAGDGEGAFRCAIAAALTETSLGRLTRERAELRTGRVGRLADELLATAKTASDPRARREAYERLAILDATARDDAASALLWHRTILEEAPDCKPSLRYVEQQLIGEGRDEELEPLAAAIARSLRGSGPGEATAHAEFAARLRLRGGTGGREAAREMIDLASGEGDPSLWTLRMIETGARASGDDAAWLAVTKLLVERGSRPSEIAALLLRGGEAALRLGQFDEARALLERATVQDAGDVVAWWLLAAVQKRVGDPRSAAESCESLARSSTVRSHQLSAWYDAGRLWLDEVHDGDRAVAALETAAALDLAYKDVFDRLSRLYVARKAQGELADLLERRIERITDPEERLSVEVQRGRILLEAGEVTGARRAFEAALSQRPDNPGALSAFADLCVAQSDWEAAEQALVRLARLLPTPEEQRDVYARLGDLYSHRLLNLSRAEVALKEVLKRAPDDVETAEKLVEIYKRQNDSARAVELQQELVARATSPDERRRRILDLASLHEKSGRDPRRAEKTLESARRESPQDVGLLRALVEFYARHHQTPAVNILLDRAAADARRALANGRIGPGPFGVLAAVFDLRGKRDAARAATAMLEATLGRPADLQGAGERAFDPALDDLLAPEMLTPALRALLARAGDALDAATPVDLRELRATPLSPDAPLYRLASRLATSLGLAGLQIYASPELGTECIPVSSVPPAIVIGQSLESDERIGAFLVFRALKLVSSKASVLARLAPTDLSVLVAAWLKCFNPTWQPPKGAFHPAVDVAQARVQALMPGSYEPDVGVLALEAATAIDGKHAALRACALEWADRVALLALGDPNAAVDAIAAAPDASELELESADEIDAESESESESEGDGEHGPESERTAWIGRTAEARSLVTFGASEAFAQARARLGLDR